MRLQDRAYQRLAIFNDRLIRINHKIDSIEANLSEAKAEKKILEQAISLVNACVDDFISYKQYIEEIQTSLLKAVMGEQYSYTLNLEYMEDGVSVKGLSHVIWEDDTPTDPGRNQGGGAQNLVSIGYRLLAVLLNPKLRPLIVLDEPLTNLSEDRWPLFLMWLDNFCENTNLQVIIITNVDSARLEEATVFNLLKRQGVTVVTKERT